MIPAAGCAAAPVRGLGHSRQNSARNAAPRSNVRGKHSLRLPRRAPIARFVGRRLAEEQYQIACPTPNASLAEHVAEFEELWLWTNRQGAADLSPEELAALEAFDREYLQDLFRILKNFDRQLNHAVRQISHSQLRMWPTGSV